MIIISSNNVVWYMQHERMWHVWYSGCIDNAPKKPDLEDKHYKEFKYRSDAILYAHRVVKEIDRKAYKEGYYTGVEYGVCEVPMFRKKKVPEYSMTQKGLDYIDQMIKRSPQYKELKQQIREDILFCRGMSSGEMINYLVELEEKYDE